MLTRVLNNYHQRVGRSPHTSMPSPHLLYIQWSRVVTWLPFEVGTKFFICEAVANKQDLGRTIWRTDEWRIWPVNGLESGQRMTMKVELVTTPNYEITAGKEVRSTWSESRLCCAVIVDERNYQDCGRFDWVTTDGGTMQSRMFVRNADVTSPETDCKTAATCFCTTGFRPFQSC